MKTQETHSKAIVNFLMEQRELGKDQIARMAGYTSRRMIDHVLSGQMRGLGNKAIERIASALEMSPAELLQKTLSLEHIQKIRNKSSLKWNKKFLTRELSVLF